MRISQVFPFLIFACFPRGFKRITSDMEAVGKTVAFSHHLFRRDQPELVQKINVVSNKDRKHEKEMKKAAADAAELQQEQKQQDGSPTMAAVAAMEADANMAAAAVRGHGEPLSPSFLLQQQQRYLDSRRTLSAPAMLGGSRLAGNDLLLQGSLQGSPPNQAALFGSSMGAAASGMFMPGSGHDLQGLSRHDMAQFLGGATLGGEGSQRAGLLGDELQLFGSGPSNPYSRGLDRSRSLNSTFLRSLIANQRDNLNNRSVFLGETPILQQLAATAASSSQPFDNLAAANQGGFFLARDQALSAAGRGDMAAWNAYRRTSAANAATSSAGLPSRYDPQLYEEALRRMGDNSSLHGRSRLGGSGGGSSAGPSSQF